MGRILTIHELRNSMYDVNCGVFYKKKKKITVIQKKNCV